MRSINHIMDECWWHPYFSYVEFMYVLYVFLHWLCCPLRAADRDLLAMETGFSITCLEDLHRVLIDSRHSIALEFVLSKFFLPGLNPKRAGVDLRRLLAPWMYNKVID
jgi:hypothetical protein